MTTGIFHTERALLLQIAAGDHAAFNRLFDQYWNTIYSVALAYTRSATQAEDLTQEVFLILWKRRETLPAVESLENYIFIMTRNEVFRALRRKGLLYSTGGELENLSDGPAGQSPDPGSVLDAKELAERIAAAVSLLPPQQRRVWELSRGQGLSHEEIAAVMGLSKNTVKNHIVQALGAVRDYLRAHGDMLLFLATWIHYKK